MPQTPLAPQTRDPDFSDFRRERLPSYSPRPTPSPTPFTSPRSQEAFSNRRSEALDRRPARRQDLVSSLLPAAIGLGSTGVSPVGIFSNLLNAYATIDSKHDITGKLINGAASWFGGPTAEVRTTDTRLEQDLVTTSPPATTARSTTTTERAKGKKKTTRTTKAPTSTTTVGSLKWPTPTSTSLRVRDRVFSSEENQEYQLLLDRIREATKDNSEYDVVTSNYASLPPQSNLVSGGPLRPKPPSDHIIQVSPSPQGYGEEEELLQFGVSNPHWYSQELSPSSTAGYGPDDFVVETVNLDKNFFYQFFTSKPMLMDSGAVTPSSVQVNQTECDNDVSCHLCRLLGTRGWRRTTFPQ